jgi:hypothetical protein
MAMLTANPAAAAERCFRLDRLDDDRRHNALVIAIMSVVMLVFVGSDYRLFGAGSTFWWLLALRLSVTAFSGSIIIGLYRCREPVRFDRLSLAWLLVATLAVSIVDATRPADYFAYLALDAVLVFSIYNVYAIPLQTQAIGAGAFTIGCAFSLSLKQPAGPMAITAYAMALALANVLGALASRRIQTALRAEHANLVRERRAHDELKAAHSEIRQLRGIVPICASCKKVRDDDGFWDQVESYIAARTEAEFSHGLCPSCARSLYPDLDLDES